MIHARISTKSSKLHTYTQELALPADLDITSPVYFLLEQENGDPIPATARVYFKNQTDSGITLLTNVGSLWELTLDSRSFWVGDQPLNTLFRKTVRLFVETESGGVYTVDSSPEITFAFKRFTGMSQLDGDLAYFTWVSPQDYLTSAAGDALSIIADKSLNANNLTSVSGLVSPTFVKLDNNYPYFKYEENLKSTSADNFVPGGFDLFLVVNLRELTDDKVFLTLGAGANQLKLKHDSGNFIATGFSGLEATASVSALRDVPYLIHVNYASGTLTITVNDSTTGNDTGGSLFTTGPLVLGDNGTDDHISIAIGPVILVEEVLTAAEIDRFVQSLMNMYGI